MVALHREHSRVATRGNLPISSHVMPGIMVFLDSVAILTTALISYLTLIGGIDEITNLYFAAAIFIWLATILLMNFAGLYRFEAIVHPLGFVDKIVLAFAITILFLLAAAFSIKISATFSRLWMGSFALGACAATLGIRFGVSQLIKRLADVQMFTRHAVVAGAGEQAKALLAHLEKSPSRFVTVVGFFAERSDASTTDLGHFPILGGFNDIDAFIRSNPIDDVIIALPWSAAQDIAAIVERLRELPINVYLSMDLIGLRLPFRSPPEHFDNMPLVEVMGRPLAGWGKLSKAILDYALGFVLVLLLLPVMALIAIAIKLDSEGPVLFRQKRYGFVNRIFEICKFRTMRHDAESSGRTVQATRDDPRVTRVGRILRRLSLDELPQLFNVLNGTMSLVGPRPHAIDHNEEYARTIRGYFARHRVKPGITGWAQVNGLRGETRTVEAMEARVSHDIYYVDNWSLAFDLQILAMTVVICLTGRNAH